MRKWLIVVLWISSTVIVFGQNKEISLNDSDILARELINEETKLYRIITTNGSVYFQNENGAIRNVAYYICGTRSEPIVNYKYEILQKDTVITITKSSAYVFSPDVYLEPKIIDEFVVEQGSEVYFTDCKQMLFSTFNSLEPECFIVKGEQMSLHKEPSIWYDFFKSISKGAI